MQTIFFFLFAASGFSGLIYESIWTHYLKLFLGHAAYAQSLVLAIFMGGMAVGSWLCSRWTNSLREPLRGYALVEGVVGLFAVFFHMEFTAVTDLAYSRIIPSLGSAGLVTAFKWSLGTLLILPQSVLLGATFPLMAAGLLRRFPGKQGSTIAMLYFSNSMGGAVGVLTSGFLLVKLLGLPGTVAVAGGINLLLCATVLLVCRTCRQLETNTAGAGEHANAPKALLLLMLTSASITGAASFAYEIAWIRLLSLVLGASTHAFELMLSAFILGLALGGLWIRRRIDTATDPHRLLSIVQVAMGTLALATLPLYSQCFAVMAKLLKMLPKTDQGYTLFNIGSHGIAMIVMLPAALCAGMTLPLITSILLKRGHDERSIGAVYGANTLGGIVGVFLAVHLGMPVFGVKGVLVLGAGLDILLGLFLLYAIRGRIPLRIHVGLVTLGATALLAASVFFHLDPLRLASGVYRDQGFLVPGEVEVLDHRDGKTATIHLVGTPGAGIFIRTNGKTDAAMNVGLLQPPRPDEATMTLAGALPLLLRPDAQEAANIGLGSGLSAHTLLNSPSLRALDTIEIEAAVVSIAKGFRPRNELVYSDPRSHIFVDDAKSYFSSHQKKYDIIVSEPPNPWVSGVSGLFSTEFYHQVNGYLNSGGIFVQWLQLYEIDLDLVISVLKAINENFRAYEIYAANDVDVLIVASQGPHVPTPPQGLDISPALSLALQRVGIRTLNDIDLRRIADRSTIEPLLRTSSIPANSDYYPYLDQHAARARFLQSRATELLSLNEPFRVVSQLGAEMLWDVSPSPSPATAIDFFTASTRARAAALFSSVLQTASPFNVPQVERLDSPVVSQRAAELLRLCATPPPADRVAVLFRIATDVVPFLKPEELEGMWSALDLWPCGKELLPEETTWLELFRAVGRRDSPAIVLKSTGLLARESLMTPGRRKYLLAAAMLGYESMGNPSQASELWRQYGKSTLGSARPPLIFRLLAAHAQEARRPGSSGQ